MKCLLPRVSHLPDGFNQASFLGLPNLIAMGSLLRYFSAVQDLILVDPIPKFTRTSARNCRTKRCHSSFLRRTLLVTDWYGEVGGGSWRRAFGTKVMFPG